jgi:CRP-like cAMP-binding protein
VPKLLDTFASHPFLDSLDARQRMLLASGARPLAAEPGEWLAREGTPAHAFFLVQSGHVALSSRFPQRGEVRFQTVGPGEVVGWSWLVPPNQWQFNCRAVDQVRGLTFDGNWLRDLCENDNALGYTLLKALLGVVATRLAAARLQIGAG